MKIKVVLESSYGLVGRIIIGLGQGAMVYMRYHFRLLWYITIYKQYTLSGYDVACMYIQ